MYEAITHAHNRVLYGKPGHRLPARAPRARRRVRPAGRDEAVQRPRVDYFRSAGPDDRRYLLFNPMTKMKVTTEGEKVIDLLGT
jgi:acyl-CoA dehydrogenase